MWAKKVQFHWFSVLLMWKVSSRCSVGKAYLAIGSQLFFQASVSRKWGDWHLQEVIYPTYLRYNSWTDGTNHSSNSTFLLHWQSNLAQPPRISAACSKSDDSCCRKKSIRISTSPDELGCPQPTGFTLQGKCSTCTVFRRSRLQGRSSWNKSPLDLKAGWFWYRSRGHAEKPIINSPSTPMKKGFWSD